ncbi:septum formation initiator family protein [Jatrophihabitans sp.]|uniref:septum formation initiator family protein n=1 Tax=Jatrophihabitans sp. TaxID=1932789 RepID=UPI002CB3A361|nr:hypothetical protein [Jatrophihabitans sp.]
MTARRVRRLPLPVLLAVLLVGGLCTLLALNTASAAQELRQRSLTERNAELSDLAQQLTRDLAAQQAPGSLASAAAAEGLIPNPNPAFLRLNADGSVTVLGSPAPASLPAPVVTPTPTAAPRPSVTPRATASPTASGTPASAGRSSPAGSTSRPSASASRSAAGSRSPAPVVTVTVTRSVPPPSPTKSSAPGGH